VNPKNEYFNQSILYFDNLSIFEQTNHLSSTNRYGGFYYIDFATAGKRAVVVAAGFASFAERRQFGEAGTSWSVVRRAPTAGAAG